MVAWTIPQSVGNTITEIANQLEHVELEDSRQDEIVWRPSNNGKFQLKPTYEAIRKRRSKVEWAPIVWLKGNIARHSFITWILAHGAFKTLSKLKKWGIAHDDTCPLCNQISETDRHLFFECNYSRYVWSKMLQYLCYSRQPAGWEEEMKWCVQHFKSNSHSAQIKKVAFNATVYHIWAERNNRIYTQQNCIGSELVKRIYNDIRLKFSAEELVAEDNAGNRQLFGRMNLDIRYSIKRPVKCKWKKPIPGWHKLNSAGSLRGPIGGYGEVIRDDKGEVIAACTGATPGQTVEKHELQGVEAGLRLAKMYNIMQLDICTDSTTVFEYLSRERSVAWDLRHTVHSIMRMLGLLNNYTIGHDYRETNRVADRLASMHPNSRFMEIIPSLFAQDLKDIVYEDSIGKEYSRL